MAGDLNQAMIIGNLTRDPELRYTPNGQSVVSFGVATNRRWVDSTTGEKREEAEFHNIVAWGKLAEICSQFLRKGRKVFIGGRLQTRSWEGQDGVKRTRTEIIASDMQILDRKGDIPEGTKAATDQDSQVEKTEVSGEAKKEEAEKATKGKSTKEAKDKEEAEEINVENIPF